MYGAYVKRRGWIKCFDGRKNRLVFCRNAGDIHKEFLFKRKEELEQIQEEYPDEFEDIEFKYKRITKDQLIDKRVIPSKKKYFYHKDGVFKLRSAKNGYFHTYCKYCNLLVDKEEYQADGVCIHCMKLIYDDVLPIYKEINMDIKKAWERAKILDEI